MKYDVVFHIDDNILEDGNTNHNQAESSLLNDSVSYYFISVELHIYELFFYVYQNPMCSEWSIIFV